MSLDNCASKCNEFETCNSFDYCTEKDKIGHISKINCRLSINVFRKDRVEEKNFFDCSTYSRITPKILSRKVNKYYDNPVSGGVTTFLSILFLLIGGALGAGLTYFVITRYLTY